MNWLVKGKQISFDQIRLMGIVNLTPDSFSDGGSFNEPQEAIEHALSLVAAGADLIDLGAESSRPMAKGVSATEENKRILPVLRSLRPKTNALISIDTTKPAVAEACLLEGADVINDISGLKDSDREMARLVCDFGAGLVLMHRRGNPETMQSLTRYEEVVDDVVAELKESFHKALDYGVKNEQIVLDPGIGFSKTAEQNLEIIANIDKFHQLGRPILLGPSRKSFIGHVTGRQIDERDYGTGGVVAWAALRGVQMFRVHDVKNILDIVKMLKAIQEVEHVRTFQVE